MVTETRKQMQTLETENRAFVERKMPIQALRLLHPKINLVLKAKNDSKLLPTRDKACLHHMGAHALSSYAFT